MLGNRSCKVLLVPSWLNVWNSKVKSLAVKVVVTLCTSDALVISLGIEVCKIRGPSNRLILFPRLSSIIKEKVEAGLVVAGLVKP